MAQLAGLSCCAAGVLLASVLHDTTCRPVLLLHGTTCRPVLLLHGRTCRPVLLRYMAQFAGLSCCAAGVLLASALHGTTCRPVLLRYTAQLAGLSCCAAGGWQVNDWAPLTLPHPLITKRTVELEISQDYPYSKSQLVENQPS